MHGNRKKEGNRHRKTFISWGLVKVGDKVVMTLKPVVVEEKVFVLIFAQPTWAAQ